MLKKPPRLRYNNGALQVRFRLNRGIISSIYLVVLTIQSPKPGVKPSARRSGKITVGDLETSLNRYRPLVEGRKQDLLDALSSLAVEKQTRATHAFRVVKQFGLPIRSKAKVDHFLAWMKAEGSPSCN